MTDPVRIALNASRRQGQPVVVLRISTSTLTELVHASGATWLVPRVAAGSLTILSLREQDDMQHRERVTTDRIAREPELVAFMMHVLIRQLMLIGFRSVATSQCSAQSRNADRNDR